ncbi:unnamed protein product [Miscanthus lutarioriparius]|uniref:Late embryogenesis abundant protein LEA-2 subgroup domain-containing protein n=1 Tax=Miscanthus lutarioriparius TaxID=422564 RepID=A0A811P0N8_9POAL|nr:unnamed protein product [Miscanthus lutarioriparius]
MDRLLRVDTTQHNPEKAAKAAASKAGRRRKAAHRPPPRAPRRRQRWGTHQTRDTTSGAGPPLLHAGATGAPPPPTAVGSRPPLLHAAAAAARATGPLAQQPTITSGPAQRQQQACSAAASSSSPLPPPHAYGDYDRAGAPDELPRRPPHHAPLPPPHRPAPSPCSSALASCLVATAFLLLSAGGAGTALFLLFRPRPPDIAVAAVRLPSFSASNGTVAFTFEQTAAVRNPNRSPLAHFDSSLRVAYAGGELGAVYIPAGLIDGGSTKHVSAVFDVPAIPVAAQPTVGAVDAASAAQSQPPAVIEVHSLLVVKGRVNVLRVLTHRVQAAKLCRVGVSPLDGTVLGFRC